MTQTKIYSEKTIARANRAFESACKAASKCRHEKYISSCYGCDLYETCPIQDRVNKNLAIKRGEVYVKS